MHGERHPAFHRREVRRPDRRVDNHRAPHRPLDVPEQVGRRHEQMAVVFGHDLDVASGVPLENGNDFPAGVDERGPLVLPDVPAGDSDVRAVGDKADVQATLEQHLELTVARRSVPGTQHRALCLDQYVGVRRQDVSLLVLLPPGRVGVHHDGNAVVDWEVE